MTDPFLEETMPTLINTSLWMLFAFAGLISFLLFGLAWVVSEKIKNAGLVDVVWALSFSVFAGFYFLRLNAQGLRAWLLLAIVFVWSLRLASYLLIRFLKHVDVEDKRYDKMRQTWKPQRALKFFFMFQFQALLAWLLSLPFLFFFLYPKDHFGYAEILGLALWAVGLMGESAADNQLAQFKDNPKNKGKTCDVGLWNYSRHPNYFFEWVIWVAYGVICYGSSNTVFGFASCALILFLFLKVSGVPLAEEQSLKSRGDEYRRYQAKTSAFVPWFKKK